MQFYTNTLRQILDCRYELCDRTYYTDWVGWLSDPWVSYASYLYEEVDAELDTDMRLVVARAQPTTYGDADVQAVWTESMPVVKHETDGFVILLGRLLGFQRQVRYLDGAARGWNVTSTAA